MQLPSLLGHTQELLGNIRSSTKPADSLIDSFFRSHKYLGSHDRRFIAETVYGTLRHLRRCEYILQQVLGEDARETTREDGLLLLVVTYLVALEGTSLTAADVAAKVVAGGTRQHVPDILAKLAGEYPISDTDDSEHLGIQYSYPTWMVRRFLDEFGRDDTIKLCESLNEPAPLTLRVNTLKTTVVECQEALGQQGVQTSTTATSPLGLQVKKRINVFSLKSFQDGMFEVQDEGSQILPILLDPKPTLKILDACAGAGGKTLGFAALMKNRGEIYATDTNAYRLRELKKRSRRAGAFNIRPMEIASLADLGDKFTGYFDLVFVDAPCSGLGTIRRNPGLKWTVTEETVGEVSTKQLEILRQCAPLVKLGGRLVYATCTVLRQENENVVERFMRDHPVFSLFNPRPLLEKLNITTSAAGDFVRLLPPVHGTDGFFCAIMTKSS